MENCYQRNIYDLRAKARRSRFVRDSYGNLRWYSSRNGRAQIWAKINHIGWSVQCPICGWRGNEFYPHPSPNLRPNCLCPRCYSKERHRLLNQYFESETALFTDCKRMLDIAPGLYSSFWATRLRPADGQYVSLDLESDLAMTWGDIVSMPFADQAFDIIVCYHVLEHVPNDRGALLDLRRVLKPDGWLLIQVPIKGEITDEDLTVSEPIERFIRYGQEDHVRQYGRDFYDRLGEAGFEVHFNDFAAQLPSKIINRFGLVREEIVVECRPSYK